MTEPIPKAVFLSYSRSDVAAARRIAEALRSGGLKVWFDENELRGAEAWDQMIRRQINDCALFVAIISKHTEERSKGYFRLEWKLAVEQTHMLLDGVPFIVPVAIDDLMEANAAVPPEFLRVQWTRLPGALPTSQFVEQVRRLLDTPTKPAVRGKPDLATPVAPAVSKSNSRVWLRAGVVTVVLALALSWVVRYFAKETPAINAATRAMPEAKPPGPAQAVLPAAEESSIAVLPFVDMSQAKDQEYFSDGLSEELLNLLAKVPQLRVIARTSSFSFKGKEADVTTIAERLHVSYVLEGSVRKSNTQLRITVQLIRVADSSHLWSETYDRQLTDIFAVQDEIAGAVVTALKLKLLPPRELLVTRNRMISPEAYNQYLIGRQFYLRSTQEGYRLAVEAFTKAIAIDPDYALAHAGLARALIYHSDYTSTNFTEITDIQKRAVAAANKSVELDPKQAECYLSRGFLRQCFWEWPQAVADYEQALALDSRNGEAAGLCARLLATLGRRDEGIILARRATEFDPLAAAAWRRLGRLLQADGQMDQGFAALDRALEIYPEYNLGLASLAEGYLLAGRPADALTTAGKIRDNWRLYSEAMAFHDLGRVAEAKQTLEHVIAIWGATGKYQLAEVYTWIGQPDQAFFWLEGAVQIHDGGLSDIGSDPILRKLKGDPRFTAILLRLKLDPSMTR